jgi:peptide/nickel transport system permease protein
LLQKTIGLLAVLFAVSAIVFFLGKGIAPADVSTVILGTEGATPAQVKHLRHQLGLDRPLYAQYFYWLGDALRGRLGISPINHLSVKSQIAQQVPVSLELAFLSVLLSTLIGVPLGVVAAIKANGIWDTGIRLTLLTIFSLPVFITGILLLLVASKYLGPLYQAEYTAISKNLVGNLQSMALPIVAIAIPTAAVTMQVTRGAMLEALEQPYIQMAHAKGARLRSIRYRHALKNALPVIITLQGFLFGIFLSGLVVVENVFSLPGLGRGLVVATAQRDFQLLVPETIIIAGAFVLTNMVVELVHPIIDRRVIPE